MTDMESKAAIREVPKYMLALIFARDMGAICRYEILAALTAGKSCVEKQFVF